MPADILCINAPSDSKNIVFISTMNLDGETNLKHKQADKRIVAACRSETEILKAFTGALIECEQPNEYLYKFDGNLVMLDG